MLALRFSAHGVVCCRRRSIVNCGASDITTLLSSAPVLVCVFFFFLWSASETEVPRADDNRLLRHFGGSLAMLRAIALHRKWCLRRTVCVVSSCGLVSSQFRFLFCFLFLAIFFCPPPPRSRERGFIIAGVWCVSQMRAVCVLRAYCCVHRVKAVTMQVLALAPLPSFSPFSLPAFSQSSML